MRKLIHSVLAIFGLVLLVSGLAMIAEGTVRAGDGRYLSPLETLPGVITTYVGASLLALLIWKASGSIPMVGRLKQLLRKNGDEKFRKSQLTAFLILGLLQVALAFTPSSTSVSYRIVESNLVLGLALNVFVAILGALGLFNCIAAKLLFLKNE